MINEDNAATRLAAALISIMESIKVYPIDVVKVEPYLLFQFREQYQKTVKILRGQYSDLRPHEISDIQLRQFKTGKAQLFFWVRDDCYELELQPSNWCFIDEVETGEQ